MRNRDDSIEVWLLVGLGVIYSLALMLISDMGYRTSLHAFVFLLSALALASRKQENVWDPIWMICMMLCLFVNLNTVFRDVPLHEERWRIETRCGAGIMTSEASFEAYEKIHTDLMQMDLKNKTLLVSDLLPFAYFYIDLPPCIANDVEGYNQFRIP